MSNERQQQILHAITEFMPAYFVYINSALHRCTYNGINFNENQIKVLMAMDLLTALTPTEISSGLNIQKGSLTTIIKSLIDIGYIRKENSIKDDRKYYLFLTEEGKKFVAFKTQENIQIFNKLFVDISESECEKITNGFLTLNNYFKKYHFRSDNMDAKKAEFNAFGPWILEITEKHPIPPLFLPYYQEETLPLMLIKVPRDIDRRQASPGMDLYDYVIGLYENDICVLQRKENSVEEIKFTYDEIEGFENFIDLLLGRFTIYLKDKKIVINYNSVSEDIIINMINIIRNKYVKKSYELPQEKFTENLDIEVLYTNLLNKMKSIDDTIKISAVQPTVKVKSEDKNFIQNTLKFILQKKLLSSLHLSNDKEIIILSRGRFFRHRKDAVHSYAITYLPIDKIKNIELAADEHYSNLQKLYLKIPYHTFIFYLDSNNKTTQDYYRKLMNKLFCS